MPSALTGTKILLDALRYAAVDGYEVNDSTAIDFINAAIEEITVMYDEVGKKVTQEYTIDSTNQSTWIDLPIDFLKEKRTYDTENESRLINAIEQPYYYMIENEQIRFDFEGKYTMEYVPIPADMTSLSETPSINLLYHRAISYYVAYRIKALIYGDEESEKGEMYQMFLEKSRKAYGRLSSRKNRRIMQSPRWA